MHENKPPLVTNPRDPRFRALRNLQTSQGRSQTNFYLIEGIRHLARAIEERAPIESVFYDPSVLSNHFGRKLVRRLIASRVPTVRLATHLYRDLTLAAEPQGIGAVLRQQFVPMEHFVEIAGKGTSSLVPKRASNHVASATEGLYLAVESIDSPGNLGTIIRTAEAAGVSGIFLLGSSDDPFHPAAVRASMGSLFSQKLVRCSPQEFTAWSRAHGVTTVASSPSGLLDYRALRAKELALSDRAKRWSRMGPAAILIGSEKRGLSPDLIESADFTVRISMRGHCDSLNVAVAAGVLLFEMTS